MVSHTTTGEWQSFEGRMRRRRAERLLLRAEIAAEAGCPDDARACIEEARALAPGLAAIHAAEQALAAQRQPEPVAAPPPTRQRWISLSVAAVMLGAVFAVTFARQARTDMPLSATPFASVVEPPAFAARNLTRVIAPSPPPTASTGLEVVSSPLVAPAPPAVLPVGNVGNDLPTEPRPLPPVASEPVARPDDAPVASAPPPVPAAAVLKEAVPLDVTPAAPATVATPPAPAPDAAIRGLLDRYAAAYSALDADAAQRVWPGVNRVALARAFDGLASQQVSLGSCRIDVGGDKARAQCAGRATWTPRVGSGTRSESRHWTFDLARSGNVWNIVSARAQNK